MTATAARVCGTKRKLTKAAADATLDRLIEQGAAPGLMDRYRCRRCRTWHVGHTRHRRRQRR